MMWLYVQAASAKVSVGSHVWVEDPEEAWIDGEVEDANSDEITVNCSGKTVIACENILLDNKKHFFFYVMHLFLRLWQR